MIKSFQHKGLRDFFDDGSLAGIQAKNATRLQTQLTLLNVARSAEEMKIAGWDCHVLKGHLAGFWAVKVSGNWRLTFGFQGEDAVLVDYQDYH